MIKISPIKFNNIKPFNYAATKHVKCSSGNNTSKYVISSAIASAISAVALYKVVKPVSRKDIFHKLNNNGFSKTKDGVFKKDLSIDEKKDIVNRYSRYSNDVKMLYNNGISKNQLEKFREFININPENNKKIMDSNFIKLFETFAILEKNGNSDEIIKKAKNNKDLSKLVTNIITNDIDYKSLNSIQEWKGLAHTGIARAAQKSLRGELKTASSDVYNFINNLNNGIENQILPTNINLYRKEGYGALRNIKFNENIDLGTKMEIIAQKKDINGINEIKEFIQNNEISTIQPAFMSTTLDKDFLKNFTGVTGNNSSKQEIIWTLHPTENTKGIYIEAINATGKASKEQEVLLKTDTKITIKDINFDMENRNWNIDAEISN